MTDQADYNRQVSTESGWDNPFRPDGDLSREADEIVSLIKGGQSITPPAAVTQFPEEEETHANALMSDNASPYIKVASPVKQSTSRAYDTTNGAAGGESHPCQVEVQRSLPQEPQQAEYVTIKKKPKCKCCIIQ